MSTVCFLGYSSGLALLQLGEECVLAERAERPDILGA